MNDVYPIVEGLLRMFVLMIPVVGVLLLFAAAHVLGGALRQPARGGQHDNASQISRSTLAQDAEQRVQSDSTMNHAA